MFSSSDETKSYRKVYTVEICKFKNTMQLKNLSANLLFTYINSNISTHVLFGGRKNWQIWRIDGLLSKLSLSNLQNIQYPFLLICRAFPKVSLPNNLNSQIRNVFSHQHFLLYSSSKSSLSLINSILSWKMIEAVWKITFLTLLRASYVYKNHEMTF